MENNTEKTPKKYMSLSVDVLNRTPYAKENPGVIATILEQYATVPRLKSRKSQEFTKHHVLAANKWMEEQITNEEFLIFCGKSLSKAGVKNRQGNNATKANDLFARIIKAKMKGQIIL